MSIICDEIQDVKNHCESQIPGSKIIACVPSMIRVDIKKTKHKQLTACLQFPESYPLYPLLIELKSKTLSEKFLSGLTKICEEECKKILGKPQAYSSALLKVNEKYSPHFVLSCITSKNK